MLGPEVVKLGPGRGLGIFAGYPFSLILSPLASYTVRGRRLSTLLMPTATFLHEQTLGYVVWNMIYV